MHMLNTDSARNVLVISHVENKPCTRSA
jgi:hypothetical protein